MAHVLMVLISVFVYHKGLCWDHNYSLFTPGMLLLYVHLYADDTQLYMSFDLKSQSDEERVRLCVEACILEIKYWMRKNKLKLNDEKTKFLVITSKHLKKNVGTHNMKVVNATVNPLKEAKNLGIIFDDNMCMDAHVKKICQSAYFHLRNISTIRKLLSYEAAKTVINALVTSRIDNCNSLLYGLPCFLITKVQRVQNAAARLLLGMRKYARSPLV